MTFEKFTVTAIMFDFSSSTTDQQVNPVKVFADAEVQKKTYRFVLD